MPSSCCDLIFGICCRAVKEELFEGHLDHNINLCSIAWVRDFFPVLPTSAKRQACAYSLEKYVFGTCLMLINNCVICYQAF